LDNAHPRNFASVTEFIDGKKSIRLPDLPYSPDITVSDIYRFGILNEKLKKCTMRTFYELKREMNSILRSILETELISIFQTWLRRIQQVIDSGGEYV
jgi:hypothetical protein